jgi:hypothetical protein
MGYHGICDLFSTMRLIWLPVEVRSGEDDVGLRECFHLLLDSAELAMYLFSYSISFLIIR